MHASEADALVNTAPLGSGVASGSFRFQFSAGTIYAYAIFDGSQTVVATIEPAEAGVTGIQSDLSGLIQGVSASVTAQDAELAEIRSVAEAARDYGLATSAQTQPSE